jgi:hypothetical protein
MPLEDGVESEKRSNFHMEPQITEKDKEDMEE